TIPIYVRIRLNNETTELSTKESVLQNEWSNSTRRVKLSAPNSKIINKTLDQIKSGIEYAFQQLLDEDEWITAKAIKLRFLGKDDHITTCKGVMAFHRKNELSKLAPGTVKNYKATETYVNRF